VHSVGSYYILMSVLTDFVESHVGVFWLNKDISFICN